MPDDNLPVDKAVDHQMRCISACFHLKAQGWAASPYRKGSRGSSWQKWNKAWGWAATCIRHISWQQESWEVLRKEEGRAADLWRDLIGITSTAATRWTASRLILWLVRRSRWEPRIGLRLGYPKLRHLWYR